MSIHRNQSQDHRQECTSTQEDGRHLWIDINGQHDDSAWMNWFSNKYCDKCENEIVSREDSLEKLGFELMYVSSTECSYCEVYKECRFFKGKNPSTLEIIEMWLNEEVEEEIVSTKL